ncbi:MAG TPA: SPOR domain-containing protein, partial [Rudaea sp.]
MFIRILFILLLALNLGAACWLYFAPQNTRAEIAPTDPGVPRLTLLNEQDHGAAVNSAELAAAPETRAELRNDTCYSIGPFATQADMRGALNSLTPLVPRIQFREAHATETRGYWV